MNLPTTAVSGRMSTLTPETSFEPSGTSANPTTFACGRCGGRTSSTYVPGRSGGVENDPPVSTGTGN
ncbi:MAG: hypothetical protein EHM24_04795, partial [Acidobacteria bacterium]